MDGEASEEITEPVIQPKQAKRYYRLDSRKVTFGEYWNIARSWKVIFPWIAKALNIRMTFTSPLPYFESVRELSVAETDFPSEARCSLHPMLEGAQRLGFLSPHYFMYASMHGDSRMCFIVLRHPSGATIRLIDSLVVNVHPPKENKLVVLLSELRDGTFFCTSDQPEKFKSRLRVLTNRLVGAPLEQLVESHLQKLEQFQFENPANPITTDDALDQLWNRYETASREEGMNRGLYEWMTPEEVTGELKGLEDAKSASSTASEHTGVMMELNKLQNAKGSWGSMIAILVVSLLLFMGTGSKQWAGDYLVILVGVLFVHELGHYLAMKLFKYRNLRMFFIPFFGAAVSGRHYNVPGWKKVVVSLMGPVPGILLGIIIGTLGLLLHQAILTKIAIIALILNGFNLLPVLPFDGGWVFHTLLFSRHPILDSGFRITAAIALLAGGMYLDNKILTYLSIPMFLSIPAATRTAKIARKLRSEGATQASADDQTIPPETALALIEEAKKSSPQMRTNKALAQQVLSIFEILNARPPGWLATVGLLFVHVGSLALALVFTGAFVVGQQNALTDLVASKMEPSHLVDCDQIREWQGLEASGFNSANQATIVATFESAADSFNVFRILTNELPQVARLKTFGESLFLFLPNAQTDAQGQWKHFLMDQTKDVFVDRTNYWTRFSLSMVAPDPATAEAIADEMNSYLSTLPQKRLVPPWLPHDQRSTNERAEHQRARMTYLRLQRSRFSDDDESVETTALYQQLKLAIKEGKQSEIDSLQKQINELRKQSQQKRMQAVLADSSGELDTNIYNLYLEAVADQGATNSRYDQLEQEMAHRMGQLEEVDGLGLASAEPFTSQMGVVTQDDAQIDLIFVSFNRIAYGAPALVNWLCEKGCTNFKYELLPVVDDFLEKHN